MRKKYKKISKKVLTNGNGGGIIARLSRKTASAESKTVIRKYEWLADRQGEVVETDQRVFDRVAIATREDLEN